MAATEARVREQGKLETKIKQCEEAGDYVQASELRSLNDQILQPRVLLLLLIDQLEEIFTITEVTAQERAEFVAVLDALARSGFVWAIATLRADFLSRLSEIPMLVRLLEGGGEYRLLPPNREELGQMIRLPALSAGLRFEERVKTRTSLDQLLRDEAMDDPLALPLLEFALRELFERRQPCPDGGALLTVSTYARIRKLRGAIGRQAEAAFKALRAPEQGAFTHVMRGVVTLNVGEHGEAVLTRRWNRHSAISAIPGAAALVEAFVAARLFVADHDSLAQDAGGGHEPRGTFSVAHEALLTSWPRLKRWVARERDFLKRRARIEGDLAKWQEEKEAAGYLLDGRRLADACTLLEDYREDLTPQQVDFIERSRRSAESGVRQRMRRLRVAVAGFAALALVALVGALFALQARKAAQTQSERATAARGQAEELIDSMLGDLIDELQKVGRLELLERITQLVQRYYARASSGTIDPVMELHQGMMFSRIGDVCKARGDFKGAAEAYELYVKAFGRLVEEDDSDVELQSRLSEGWEKLGEVRQARGDHKGASEAYGKNFDIAQKLFDQDPTDADRQRRLGLSSEKIHEILLEQGELKGPLKLWAASYQLAAVNAYTVYHKSCQKRADENPADLAKQTDLAESWLNIGNMRARQSERPEAIEAFIRALEIYQRLTDRDPTNAELQRQLAGICQKLGKVRQQQSNFAGAEEAFKRALDISLHLVSRDPGNAEWQRDLAACWEGSGDLRQGQGDVVGAADAYARGLKIFEELAARNANNAIWQRELARIWRSVGNIREKQGSLDTAADAFERSLQIAKQMAERDSTDAKWQRDLALSWEALAEVRQRRGDVDAAFDAFQSSLKIAAQMVDKDPDNANWLRDLGAASQRVGELYQARGNLSAAVQAFAKSVKIYEDLSSQQSSNPEWKRQLANNWRSLADIYQTQGNLRDAAEAVAQASQLTRQATHLHSEDSEWIASRVQDVSERIAWKILGERRRSEGDLRGASEAFLQGVQAAQRLASHDENDSDWQRQLAEAWESLGEAREAQADLRGRRGCIHSSAGNFQEVGRQRSGRYRRATSANTKFRKARLDQGKAERADAVLCKCRPWRQAGESALAIIRSEFP